MLLDVTVLMRIENIDFLSICVADCVVSFIIAADKQLQHTSSSDKAIN